MPAPAFEAGREEPEADEAGPELDAEPDAPAGAGVLAPESVLEAPESLAEPDVPLAAGTVLEPARESVR